MNTIIIILCTISLIGYALFATGATVNSNKFYQIFSEKKVLFPVLFVALACQIAAVVLGFMEVF